MLLPTRSRENDVHSIDYTAYSMALEHTYRTVRQCAILSIRLNDSFLSVHLLMTLHVDAHVFSATHQSEIIVKTNKWELFHFKLFLFQKFYTLVSFTKTNLKFTRKNKKQKDAWKLHKKLKYTQSVMSVVVLPFHIEEIIL